MPFDILLKKLSVYGIRQEGLNMFESYLIYRQQYTSVKNNTSKLSLVPDGVLQGSILGPVFFLFIITFPVIYHIVRCYCIYLHATAYSKYF